MPRLLGSLSDGDAGVACASVAAGPLPEISPCLAFIPAVLARARGLRVMLSFVVRAAASHVGACYLSCGRPYLARAIWSGHGTQQARHVRHGAGVWRCLTDVHGRGLAASC